MHPNQIALLQALGHLPRFAMGGTVPIGQVNTGAIPGGHASFTPVNPATSSQGITASNQFNNSPLQLGFNAKVPTSNLNFNPGQYGSTVGNSQQNLAGVSQMLMNQANGGGPNLAEAQLKQGTDRNIAQQYAMAQGSEDPGAARNMANNIANLNQGEASQAAMLRMQQQLQAQQQLGQLSLGGLGTGGRLMTDAEKMQLEQGQGNQNAALHAQDTNAQISLANQALAGGQFNTAVNAGAGLIQGAGAAAAQALSHPNAPGAQTTGDPTQGDTSGGFSSAPTPLPDTPSGMGDFPIDTGAVTAAYGGLIPRLPRFAQGGQVPGYDWTPPTDVADPNAPNLAGGGVHAPGMAGGARGGGQGGDPNAGGWGTAWDTGMGLVPVAGPAMVAARHLLQNTDVGKKGMPAVLFGDKQNDPNQNQDRLTGGHTPDPIARWTDNAISDAGSWIGNLFHASGGPVPGRAKAGGDNERNDTVPAVLSPGEVVLPRSVTQAEDAPEKAMEFMRAVAKSKAPKPSFGDVIRGHNHMQQRIAKLEAMFRGGRVNAS